MAAVRPSAQQNESPVLEAGLFCVLASLMCESWNHLLEWLGEVVILCAGDG